MKFVIMWRVSSWPGLRSLKSADLIGMWERLFRLPHSVVASSAFRGLPTQVHTKIEQRRPLVDGKPLPLIPSPPGG
eukprot:1454068-Pyramimonas_sp.AAC.1